MKKTVKKTKRGTTITFSGGKNGELNWILDAMSQKNENDGKHDDAKA